MGFFSIYFPTHNYFFGYKSQLTYYTNVNFHIVLGKGRCKHSYFDKWLGKYESKSQLAYYTNVNFHIALANIAFMLLDVTTLTLTSDLVKMRVSHSLHITQM